jgi:hypothetical protein
MVSKVSKVSSLETFEIFETFFFEIIGEKPFLMKLSFKI